MSHQQYTAVMNERKNYEKRYINKLQLHDILLNYNPLFIFLNIWLWSIHILKKTEDKEDENWEKNEKRG